MSNKPFLLVDNYDSFTYNLVQYLEDIANHFKIWRNDEFSKKDLKSFHPKAVLISPGPARPQDSGLTPYVVEWCVANKVPLLGVCLGHQAIGEYFGAQLIRAQKVVHGKISTITHDGLGVFEGLEEELEVGRYHSLALKCVGFPRELKITSQTIDDQEIMGLRHNSLNIEGIQFHPESLLTPQGKKMLRNFFDRVKI